MLKMKIKDMDKVQNPIPFFNSTMKKHLVLSLLSRSWKGQLGFSNQTALLLIAICYPLGIASIAVAISSVNRYSFSGPTAFELNPAQQNISEQEARSVIQEWWSVRPRVFAPPYDASAASPVVSSGPLWSDLTKSDGPVAWLRNNQQYYTYQSTQIKSVISFNSQESSQPYIVVRVTTQDTLHGPGINRPSTGTNNYKYIFSRENGKWKIWNYEKV